MPSRSSTVSLAVPISIPRYSCIESQLTTSPSKWCASCKDNADLPDAVGPTTTMGLSFSSSTLLYLPSCNVPTNPKRCIRIYKLRLLGLVVCHFQPQFGFDHPGIDKLLCIDLLRLAAKDLLTPLICLRCCLQQSQRCTRR